MGALKTNVIQWRCFFYIHGYRRAHHYPHAEVDTARMQLFVICLLLALTNSQAAVVSHPSSLGNTFSVARIRQNTTRIRDGFVAHSKAFAKYGWTDLNINSNIFSSTGPIQGQTGTVNTTAEEYDAAYIAPITISTGASAQTLNIDFDTGSSDFWVFSTLLGPEATVGHNVFDPLKSKTFHNASGLDWEIGYGDGSGAAGIVGTDRVQVGGVTVTRQAVELASAVSRSFIEDTDSDGLVGLAFKKINRGGWLNAHSLPLLTLLKSNPPSKTASSAISSPV